MISRDISQKLLQQLTEYPIVTLLGPRQAGKTTLVYFYRDSHGNEIDLLYTSGRELVGIEVKSSSTFTSHFKKTLLRFSEKRQPLQSSHAIYNGEERQFSDGVKAINFRNTSDIFA